MTTFRVTDGGKSLRIEIRPEGVLVEIDSGCGTCSVVMSHEKAREAVGWIFDRTPVMGAAPPAARVCCAGITWALRRPCSVGTRRRCEMIPCPAGRLRRPRTVRGSRARNADRRGTGGKLS